MSRRVPTAMSAQNFEDLLQHYGHMLVLARYTDNEGDVAAVAVECEDCNEVLLDYDNELLLKTETPNACNCDECECKNQDDYTEENGTCEDCFRDCQITEGGE